MQDIQQRVQSAITKLMDTLDHSHLRKFQVRYRMHCLVINIFVLFEKKIFEILIIIL